MTVSATQLNEAHAAYLSDPENSNSFWTTLTSYVDRCLFRTPRHLRPDLTQDVVLEVFKSISKFQRESKFSKWTNGVLYHVRADAFKKSYREAEYITLGVDLPEQLEQPDIPLAEEEVSRQLDSLAAALKEKSKVLFNLLRQGHSLHQTATLLNEPYKTTQSRWLRMKTKLNNLLPELHPDLALSGCSY